MQIRPFGGRVVVKREEPKRISAGGIHLPAADKPLMARVVAVTWVNAEEQPKEGDLVLLGPYAGIEFEADGVQYLAVQLEDICAIFYEESEE